MEESNKKAKIIFPKQYLPFVIAVVALFLVIFLGVETVKVYKESRYIGQGLQYKNTINISGEGKVLAAPDIGQVSLSVISDAKTVAAALRDNTTKMNKVTKSMKDSGIKEEDMKTTNYNISPRYQYLSGKSEIIGYEVSQTLEVKIRDLDKVGGILEKAAAAGANQVGSLSFTFDDVEKLKVEARQKAIDNAKTKARDLAKSLGMSLGKIVSFTESSSGFVPQPMYSREGYGIGGGGATPDIQTGQNEIQANVVLAYEIF